jgi:hypothetical protein
MATVAELLIVRRDAIVDELTAMSSTAAGGLPNASGGGDKLHIDHVGYRMSLYQELEQIEKRLLALEGTTIIETIGEI